MNENIKTVSLVVIALSLFIQTIMHIVGGGVKTSTTNSPAPQVTDPNQPPVSQVDPNIPKTAILFNETEFNFGDIKEGEKVSHNFKFTNTGENPLVISNAYGSCGCTVPIWPKEPIPPGGSGEILVEYDSKGRSGTQFKTVTIVANTTPENTVINIKSNVIGGPAPAN